MDVGYSYQNVLTIKRPDNVDFKSWQKLEQALQQQSSIQSTGLAVFPSIGEYNSMALKNLETQENYRLYWIGVDHNYIPTMKIDLISGRNFDPALKSDEQSIIVNQKALELIGGEKFLSSTFQFRKKPIKIIGVVQNFNSHSLKEEVQPMMMSLNNPIAFRNMIVRYSGLKQPQIIQLINEVCNELNIATFLNVTFMENDYNLKLLQEENVLSVVSRTFSFIAIIISFLGLFSYLSFVIGQKKKVFSIRKVLGAELINNLAYILKTQYVTLLVAIVVSIPIAVYFLDQWINQFVYQLNINLLHLLLPIFIVLFIITIIAWGFSILINRMNLVKNLKDD